MPILSGCCFCFDLKVGSTIIGALNLVSPENQLQSHLHFSTLFSCSKAGPDAHSSSPPDAASPAVWRAEEHEDALAAPGVTRSSDIQVASGLVVSSRFPLTLC
ncbi:uncharacterized protein LOC119578374 [Penaeus monodon]|uniref:uncharacterized protein LOC119578374 n=1 Tax=Penaeus monodon TaxID=6687 RepID=UPI0018A708B6|nr:uncharacterized protein LOC119578374 [Penaeus monodon]